MVVVAVAGGTGQLGRTLVEAILSTAKHQVFILSRKADEELERKLGAPIIAVDYSNVESLAKILEDKKIHTVVSALTMLPTQGGPPIRENELIQAADAAETTQRIISSDWGFPHKPEDITKLPSVAVKLEAHALLKKTKTLEWTTVHNGFFMDYWGFPKVKSNMPPMALFLDIPNKTAALPGSGDTPAIFSHTSDIGRYVAALLDADAWDKVSYVVGDHVTWNQFTRLAESVTGTKFNVTHDSVEKLQRGEVTELPGHVPSYQFFPKEIAQPLFATFGLWFDDGSLNFPTPKTLNAQFPHIKALTVEEMLEKAWKN